MRRPWRVQEKPADGPKALIFADTFNRYFEPENLRAAHAVLMAMDLPADDVTPVGERPLCCGRTYLAAGMIDEAKAEMTRTVDALRPAIQAGLPIVGLEPSCILTLRDEAPRLLDGWTEEDGKKIKLFEEFIHDKDVPVRALSGRALVHGHCHQKAEDVMGPVADTLSKIPGLDVQMIDSSCCGMAGAFGYQAETVEVSKAMGELSLFPTIRTADAGDLIVADGTSCRHQIADGTHRNAVHVARVLEMALAAR